MRGAKNGFHMREISEKSAPAAESLDNNSPFSEMPNGASPSGSIGEQTIFAIRVSPRPLRSDSLRATGRARRGRTPATQREGHLKCNVAPRCARAGPTHLVVDA